MGKKRRRVSFYFYCCFFLIPLEYHNLIYILGDRCFFILFEKLMAHKKAAGSVKNLKDSQPKYRGVKVFGGQPVRAGNIIIRQKGSKYECGKNTYTAADFSVHAGVDGIVSFRKKNFKKFNGRTYLKTLVEVVDSKCACAASSSAANSSEKKVKAPSEKKVAKTAVKKPAVKKAPSKKAEKAE